MLERILRLALANRAVVLVLVLAAAGAGALALRELPIDAVPDVTNRQVQINTLVPALSPLEVEQQVTFPIERQLAGVPGLDGTRSISRGGFSQVTAVFHDDVDIYFARAQVLERLAPVRASLPAGAEPALGPISTGLGEIYMYTVAYAEPRAPAAPGAAGWQPDGAYLTPEGETLRGEVELAAWLRSVHDWVVRPQLQGVEGVAGVDSIGGWVPQYVVQPDPMRLVSYGLTFEDLIRALEENNLSTGAGWIEHHGEASVVRATGRIRRLEEVGRIVVAAHGGVPVRVADVAVVARGGEPRTGSASENGREVVVGTALMRIGENSRTVSAAVHARVAEVRRSLPPGVELETVLNRTRLVDATIATVGRNLLEGALLVIVVLFLLLGNFRAALVCALAIPLSMLLASIGMVRAGISGNLMSLGAIDFGLIVDGAVIIVENSLRRLAERQRALGRPLALRERIEAVSGASAQVLQPTAFGVAIITLVYLPILALSGVEGKMFEPMALTVVFALVAAFVLSLTFVPAAVAVVVRGPVREAESPWMRLLARAYEPVLRFSLRRRAALVLGAVLAFLAALGLFSRLGQEFVPTLDEQDFALHAIRIPGTGLEQSTAMQLEVERTIAAFPEVAFVFSKTGTAEVAADPMPPNVSDAFLVLRPREEWPDPAESKDGLRRRIHAAVAALPGNNYEWTQPIQMRFNELLAGVRGDVAVKVFGDDYAALVPAAERIAGVLRSIRGAADVRVEQVGGLPELLIDIDREAAGRLGLSVADVQDVVGAAVGGRAVGLVYQGDRRFELVVRLDEARRRDVEALRDLPVPLPRADDEPRAGLVGDGAAGGALGGFVPLSALATVRVADGLSQISREDGRRRVVVQANVRERDLGSFVAEAQERVRAVSLPSGSWLAWGGQYENLVSARERLALVVPACFLLILGLLYLAFRAWRPALLVFSGVPLGLTGGILALWARGLPFSISAAVGFIALSGVAVLNGLVLVSFVRELQQGGMERDEAVRRGALARLRPVLTTALVASLGFVPMALSTGTGAEVQRPLATVVIGGLITSTVLTLLVLPALYSLVARGREVEDPEAAA